MAIIKNSKTLAKIAKGLKIELEAAKDWFRAKSKQNLTKQ